MDEQRIDAVALGLQRGPRGAVAVLVLIVAVPTVIGFASQVHARDEAPVPQAGPPALEPLTAPSRVKRTRKKAPPAAAVRPSAPTRRVEPPPMRAAPPEPPALSNPPVMEAAPVALEAEAAPVEPSPAELPPPPPPPEPEPDPALEPTEAPEGNGAAIAHAVASAKRKAVRDCFEHELKQRPTLKGTVVVELELSPPNRVDAVKVSDDLARPGFTQCVTATMHELRFAQLDEEISVRVPYVLTPEAK